MIFVIVILGLAVLVLIHEFGHFLIAKLLGMRVEEFGIGFPPRLFGWRRYKGGEEILISKEKEVEVMIEGEAEIVAERTREVDRFVPVRFWRFFWRKEKLEEKMKGLSGGTVYSINLLPFGGFVRLFGEDESLPGGFNEELAWKKSLVVLAGVFMNVALGWILLSLVFMIGVPRHLMIAEVAPNSPAFTAGLAPGDVILGVKAGDSQLSDPVSSDDFTKLVKSYSLPVNFEIGRGEQKLNLDISPRANPPQGQGPIGVNITEVGFEAQPVFQSLASGFLSGWETVKMVFSGLGIFVAQLFTSPQSIQNVAGPVGIVVLAAQATSLGFIYFIQLLALISINLAVLNLLPFPALDGGRFLFLMIDKLRGKPVPRKVQAWVNSAGFIILILLMVFVTVKDIGRLL